MFKRIASIATGSGQLFQAEGDVLLSKIQRLGNLGVILLLAAMVFVAGVGVLMAGLMLALAQALGWVASLAITAALMLIASVTVWLFVKNQLREALSNGSVPVEIRRRVHEAKSTIRDDEPAPVNHGDDSMSIKDKTVRFVMKHPGLAAGGALIAVGLLGPGRSMKFASRTMLLAGLASSAAGQLREENHDPEPSDRTA